VIIGIVDGGIWPESLSFSDRNRPANGNASKEASLSLPADPGLERPLRSRARSSTPRTANQKLIGARPNYKTPAWGRQTRAIDAQAAPGNSTRRATSGRGHGHAHRQHGWGGKNQNVRHGRPLRVVRSVQWHRTTRRASRPIRCAGRPVPAASCLPSTAVGSDRPRPRWPDRAWDVDQLLELARGPRPTSAIPFEIAFLYWPANAGRVSSAASARQRGRRARRVAQPGVRGSPRMGWRELTTATGPGPASTLGKRA